MWTNEKSSLHVDMLLQQFEQNGHQSSIHCYILYTIPGSRIDVTFGKCIWPIEYCVRGIMRPRCWITHWEQLIIIFNCPILDQYSMCSRLEVIESELLLNSVVQTNPSRFNPANHLYSPSNSNLFLVVAIISVQTTSLTGFPSTTTISRFLLLTYIDSAIDQIFWSWIRILAMFIFPNIRHIF